MIPDSLHGGAGVSVGVGIEHVVAEIGIVGRERYVSALGQLCGIRQIRIPAKAGRLRLSDSRRLMQAAHGRKLAVMWRRNEEVGRHAGLLLGRVGDCLPTEFDKSGFLAHVNYGIESPPARVR